MEKHNKDINPKVAASAVGTAIATIIVFIAVKAGLEMTPEEAVSITGALSAVFSAILGWRVPSNA